MPDGDSPKYVYDEQRHAYVSTSTATEKLSDMDLDARVAQAFSELDLDASGQLTPDEILRGIMTAFPEVDLFRAGDWVASLVVEADLDVNGLLSVDEVLQSRWKATLLSGGDLSDEKHAQRFVAACETFASGGLVNRAQLTMLMERAFPSLPVAWRDEYARQLIDQADIDRDGMINLEEFLQSRFKHLMGSMLDPVREEIMEEVRRAESARRGQSNTPAPGYGRAGMYTPDPGLIPRPSSAPVCRDDTPLLRNPPRLPQRRPYIERLAENNQRPTGLRGEAVSSSRLIERAEGAIHAGGDWREALDCFLEAAAMLRAEGGSLDAAHAWIRAADCHRSFREIECAGNALAQASVEFKRAGEMKDAAVALTAAVKIYIEHGRHSKAATHTRTLCELLVELGDVPGALECSEEATKHFLAKGQQHEAAKQEKRTAELALVMGDYGSVCAIFDSLSLWESVPGKPAVLSPRRQAPRCHLGERVDYHLAATLCRLVRIKGAPGDPDAGLSRLADCDAAAAAAQRYERATPDWRRGVPQYDTAMALLDGIRRPDRDDAPKRCAAAVEDFLEARPKQPRWMRLLLDRVVDVVADAQQLSMLIVAEMCARPVTLREG